MVLSPNSRPSAIASIESIELRDLPPDGAMDPDEVTLSEQMPLAGDTESRPGRGTYIHRAFAFDVISVVLYQIREGFSSDSAFLSFSLASSTTVRISIYLRS